MTERRYTPGAPLMSPEITPEAEAKFWAKVDRSLGQGPTGECWIWIAGFLKQPDGSDGYPCGFSTNGKSYRPSHIAMTIDGRPRPSPELEALHSCDHRPCVNPQHLRWGTREENWQEALDRRKHGPRCLPPEIVREIRSSTERNFEIANRLGLTQACICNIRRGVSHKHVS